VSRLNEVSKGPLRNPDSPFAERIATAANGA
jgi:hypothetical protein